MLVGGRKATLGSSGELCDLLPSLSVNWHKDAHLVVLQGGSGETASEKMLSKFLPLRVGLVTVTVALTHSLLAAEPDCVFQ